MPDLIPLIKNYTIKHDKKIREICAPLRYLNIPVFSYYFIEEDGNFGYLSNAVEFHDYYYTKKLYLVNPYIAHPSLFRSGHVLSPCTFDESIQQDLNGRFNADHFFLTLQCQGTKMEGFVFANEKVEISGSSLYTSQLDLLAKFGRYFKREAEHLLGRMKAEQFNVKQVRGDNFLKVHPSVPLSNHNPHLQTFLKEVTGLSFQEQRCLELFKLGNSAQATAAIMKLSQRTVEHYFENIKNKLGCQSKWDLLQY